MNSKLNMTECIYICLHQGGAVNASFAEIQRCVVGRAGAGAMLHLSPGLIADGSITDAGLSEFSRRLVQASGMQSSPPTTELGMSTAPRQERDFHGYVQYRDSPDMPWHFYVCGFDGTFEGESGLCSVLRTDDTEALVPIDAEQRILINGRRYGPRYWTH